jgi:hypothetical protein
MLLPPTYARRLRPPSAALSLWISYRGEFTAWLIVTSLLASFVYVRGRTRLSFLKAVVADVAMTDLVWPLTVAVPRLSVGRFRMGCPTDGLTMSVGYWYC